MTTITVYSTFSFYVRFKGTASSFLCSQCIKTGRILPTTYRSLYLFYPCVVIVKKACIYYNYECMKCKILPWWLYKKEILNFTNTGTFEIHFSLALFTYRSVNLTEVSNNHYIMLEAQCCMWNICQFHWNAEAFTA